MRRTTIAALMGAMALALGACGGTGEEPAANTAGEAEAEANALGNDIGGNAAEAGNVTAKVLAMNDSLRNITLVRALIDLDLPCEGVLKSERMDDYEGLPVWRAQCKSGDYYLISIDPGGIAHVRSRPQR
ncbi:hypothetical protein ACFQ1E_05605 [Sphingomonas canadensis]|uniref:PepSY domain-containing protein n=1 Tax=Sphingomonas canadensis TaxID=1219257 RepID=A0ABW3H3S1_9SPHN|nr:hypothetical protein [Sphingomonas canadensis]MCW3835736.1 hypothetical protein [Sphingomonas canadensis]